MILIIDNYDSFTYNLYQYFLMLDVEVEVVRNDAITINAVQERNVEAIVLSPGPGRPEDSGVCIEIVKQFSGRIPIFGVCLGMQVIASAMGATIIEATEPMHGKNSFITHTGVGVFCGIKNPQRVTRYHSLIVDPSRVPEELEVTAKSEMNEIMGLRSRDKKLEGVQFHPEALMTEMGLEMLKNFVEQWCRSKGSPC
ncbi:aminodeoxychorismate/anthranilate synthase component II [Puniceicoccaceae bacterium K14]|nr:aminodeoxychorismate/anthranilate synthase component II [Puniceicoccaceae bacterium K14]